MAKSDVTASRIGLVGPEVSETWSLSEMLTPLQMHDSMIMYDNVTNSVVSLVL